MISAVQRLRGTLLAACLAATAVIAAEHVRAEDLALKQAASMTGVVLALSSGAPGLVLAVVRGEESLALGFGETRAGSKTEPNGRSILRVGSIAKAMAGHVLASMAADGTEPFLSTPEEYAADIDKEETKWSTIVRKSGAKAE